MNPRRSSLSHPEGSLSLPSEDSEDLFDDFDEDFDDDFDEDFEEETVDEYEPAHEYHTDWERGVWPEVANDNRADGAG